MSKSYSGAEFSTKGNWLIPFVFGWSKSIVLFGSAQIGAMYTIHITPFLNIGVNNPKTKYKYEPKEIYVDNSDEHTVDICSCGNELCDCTIGMCECENGNITK